MLDADDSVDSVKVVGEDTFTIDVEEKHTDERYFNQRKGVIEIAVDKTKIDEL